VFVRTRIVLLVRAYVRAWRWRSVKAIAKNSGKERIFCTFSLIALVIIALQPVPLEVLARFYEQNPGPGDRVGDRESVLAGVAGLSDGGVGEGDTSPRLRLPVNIVVALSCAWRKPETKCVIVMKVHSVAGVVTKQRVLTISVKRRSQLVMASNQAKPTTYKESFSQRFAGGVL
jgi:hypothetical protein